MPEARSALASRAARLGLIGVGADQRGDFTGQGGDAVDAFSERAELGVEGDAGQFLRPGVEAGLEVLVPEEAGVVQAGGQHAAVAGGEGRAAVGGLDIGDDDEVRGEAMFRRIADGEILLVHLHRQPDHLGRQAEELGVHVAEDGGRPFGQTRDLVQQAVVVDEGEPLRRGDGLRGVEDLQLAVGDVEQDVVGLELAR
jgi:hypothetical protein